MQPEKIGDSAIGRIGSVLRFAKATPSPSAQTSFYRARFFVIRFATKLARIVLVCPLAEFPIGKFADSVAVPARPVEAPIVFRAILALNFSRIPAKSKIGVFAAIARSDIECNHATWRNAERYVFIPRALNACAALNQQPAECASAAFIVVAIVARYLRYL